MNPFMKGPPPLPKYEGGFFGTFEYIYAHPQYWGLTKGLVTFGIGVIMARAISQEFANPSP